MKEAPHNIQRAVFDIGFFSSEKSHELQEKISSIFHSNLQQKIAQLFAEYSIPGETVQIEQLLLDTGRIEYEDVERELPARVIAALRNELDKLKPDIYTNRDKQEYKVIRSATWYLQSLGHYLVHGTLRWQDRESYYTPADLLAELLKKHTTELVALLRRAGKQESVRKRIAFQFREPLLVKIIHTLEPSNGNRIITYMEELEKTRTRSIQNADRQHFKKAKYLFVLNYLLVERGSAFNTRSFVRSLIRQMAAHYNINYHGLLLELTRHLHNYLGSPVRKYGLLHIIRDIFMEDYKPARTATAISPIETPAILQEAVFQQELSEECLYFFLEKGFLPARARNMHSAEIIRGLHRVLESHPDKFIDFANRAGTGSVAENIAAYFPAELTNVLIGTYRPERSGWIGKLRAAVLQAESAYPFISKKDLVTSRLIEEAIIHTILVSTRIPFNRKSFLMRLFHYLSKRTGTAEKSFLEKARYSFNQSGNTGFSSLITGEKQIAGEGKVIKQEDNNPERITAAKTIEKTDSRERDVSLIEYYLIYGRHPWWNKDVNNPPVHMVWNKRFFQHTSKRLLAFIRKNIHRPEVRKNMLLLMNTVAKDAAFPNLKKEKNELQPGHWTDIRNKLDQQTYKALTEIYLLHFFSKNNLQEEALWNEIRKILVAQRVTPQAFYAELKLLGETIPDIYFTGFFSMLYSNLEEQHPGSAVRVSGIKTEQVHGRKEPEVNRKKNEGASPEKSGRPYANEEEPQLNNFLDDSHIHERFIYNHHQHNQGQKDTYTSLAPLLEYLHTGALPTSAGINSKAYFLEIIRSLNKSSNMQELKLFYFTIRHPASRNRLLKLFTDEELLIVTGILFSPAFSFLEIYYRDLVSLLSLPAIRSRFRTEKELLNTATFTFLTEHFGKNISVAAYLRYVTKQLFRNLSDFSSFSALARTALLKKEIRLRTVLPALLISANLPEKKKKKPKEEREEPEPAGDAVYIENAGLILLWPFLGHYFHTLELMEENRFISADAAHRALYLLQYLVTGTEDTAEHHLPLNKLLCSVPQQDTPLYPGKFTPAELALSDELLTIAISRWEIISNTSIEGFRESFLKRTGKLEWDDEKITLKVESKPYDMLLDKIPWSISMVKLPWMENALFIKWR